MFKQISPRFLIILPVLFFLTISTFAEVPKVISYQGRLTDAGGNPVPDGNYNLTFQIVEFDPLPIGSSPLWSSGEQTVTVSNGLFVYYLGSNVPLPTEIFNNDSLTGYFLRIKLPNSMLFQKGSQLVTTPFSIRSIYSDTAVFAGKSSYADTAGYALSSPGGVSSGWVDDGSVVHLATGSDNVGIGTSTPTDKLVIGGNLGSSYDDYYIVTRNNSDAYSGYKLGFNSDNFGWMSWYSYDGSINFGTRQEGINHLNTLILNNGNLIAGGTGDSSVQLGDNAINSEEILNEPGIVYGSTGDWIHLVSADWREIADIQIHVPGPGYVLILASFDVEAWLPSADVSDFAIFSFCLSSIGNFCDSDSEDFHQYYWVGGNFESRVFSTQWVKPVNFAGTREWHLNGNMFSTRYGNSYNDGYYKCNYSAIYIPSWYGTSTAPVVSTGNETSIIGGDISSVLKMPDQSKKPDLNQMIAERVHQELEATKIDFQNQIDSLKREIKSVDDSRH